MNTPETPVPQKPRSKLERMAYVLIAAVLLGCLVLAVLPALAKAKKKAQRIRCVNNLKDISRAAIIWGGDHGGGYPSDFTSFQKELGTPVILWCPSDTARKAAMDWNSVGPSNISYDFVSPGNSGGDPSLVVFRCPIHGNVVEACGAISMIR
jgi:hypothetical protein